MRLLVAVLTICILAGCSNSSKLEVRIADVQSSSEAVDIASFKNNDTELPVFALIY